MEYKGYISHLNYTYEKITKSNESLAVVRARMSSEGEKITTLWRSVERTCDMTRVTNDGVLNMSMTSDTCPSSTF